MSSSAAISTGKAKREERRSSPREVLRHYVVLVYFGEDNWGKLTNMSETGMAFEFSRPPVLHERVNFTFQVMGCMPMPHDAGVLGESFEAAGEIVWMREFERIAGVHFVDLADANKKYIRQWLSFEAASNPVASTAEPKEEVLPLAAEETESPILAALREEPETVSKAEAKESLAEPPAPEPVADAEEEPEPPLAVVMAEAPATDLTDREEDAGWQPRPGASPVSHPSVARLTFLVVSGCLAAFAVTAGVRVFMARAAHRADGGESALGTAAAAESTSAANLSSPDSSPVAPEVSPAEAAPPFQIEVLDESGKRWMLWFVHKDSKPGNELIPRRTEITSPGPSASAARAAKSKDTAVPEEPQTANTYTLAGPNLNRPADSGSPAGNPLPEAPAIQKESGAAPEEPPGGILNAHVTPPALEVPVGGMVQQARLIHSVPPVYPSLAKLTRVSGDVTVDALIDVSGNVKTVKVLTGPVMLQQAAVETVRQWKYEPARLDGQAVAMHLTVTVKFRLN